MNEFLMHALCLFLYTIPFLGAISKRSQKISWLEKKLRDYEDLSDREKSLSTKALQLTAMEKQLSDKEMDLSDRSKMLNTKLQTYNELIALDERAHIIRTEAQSYLSALPYFSRILADYETRGLDILAAQLDWGANQERQKKVKSIREIKKDTVELLATYKEAEYQLAYAIQMFPALEDFLASEFSPEKIPNSLELLTESHDAVRRFLSNDEYNQLSVTERNQLALDRYWASHTRSSWQVGRDYEQYIGYRYSQKGYQIEYYGIENGLEDLGRDIIAKNTKQTLIIQCKYWSSKKQIHEKHINQLYGTIAEYCFENDLNPTTVRGILVTNISLSDTAKRFASYLGVEVVENYPLGKYPCIKCNINRSTSEKIYHLPFDQQYDSCKISTPGEFYATTVLEAEKAGFRRAHRWYASNDM